MRINLFGRKYHFGRIAEAVGQYYLRDAAGDEGSWTPLGMMQYDRSTPKIYTDEATNRAYRSWVTNPHVKRITELYVSYTVGGGIKIVCNDDAVQKWVNEFWSDRSNNMDWRIREMARGGYLAGELFPVPATNKFTGRVKLGFLDPRQVQEIKVDPKTGQERELVVYIDNRPVCFRIIYRDENGTAPFDEQLKEFYGEVAENRQNINITKDRLVGQAFYWPFNRPVGAVRGSGDLVPSVDWATGLDQLLWAVQDKAKLSNHVFLTLTDEEATAADLANMSNPKHEKYVKKPKLGTVLLQNKMIKWGFITPDLNAQDMAEAVKMFKGQLEVSSGFPEHWFGQGGDVNRATALEMNSPVYKMLSERQAMFVNFITDLVQYVIDQGRIYSSVLDSVTDFGFKVNTEEIAVKDETTSSVAVQNIINGVTTALSEQLMTKEEARTILSEAYSKAGYKNIAAKLPEELQTVEPATAIVSPTARKLMEQTNGLWQQSKTKSTASN